MILKRKHVVLAGITWCILTLATYVCLREDDSMIHKEGELVHADQLMWKETDYVHSAPVHSDLKGHQDEAQDPDVGTSEENLEEKAKKRSRAYCNPVDDIPVGSEGAGPEGYELVHVHLIIRHGDRSPMYTLPNFKAPVLSCDLREIHTEEAHGFIHAMDSLKDGLGRPHHLNQFNFYPRTKQCNGAQLTGLGALQHHRLGSHLNTVYIMKNHLLGSDMPNLSQLYVRTTEYSRTFQSAAALLHGMLPKSDLSQMNLEAVQNVNLCSGKHSGMPCSCQAASDLHLVIKKEERKRTANDTVIMDIKRQVASVLGVSLGNLPWLSAMLEVMMTQVCHDLELPCIESKNGSETKCISWETVHQIWDHLDKEGLKSTSSYASHRYDRLNMHPLLYEIVNRLLSLTRKTERTKMVLYSGHDLTLTPLLKVLGIFDGKWPPYASRLALETWRNSDNQFFLRTVYNGEDRTHSLRFCSEDELVNGLCPLDNFIYFVRYKDIKFFGKSSYAKACER